MFHKSALILAVSFLSSSFSFAIDHPHQQPAVAPHVHQNEEDCPVCLDQPSSNQMMCSNRHSMGCESCVESIAAKAAAEGREPQCPLCRKTFDLAVVKEQSARIERELAANRLAQQRREANPVPIDREAIRRQLIEQERQSVLRELGEAGRQQIRAQHLATIRQNIRQSFSAHEIANAQQEERNQIVQDIRAHLRRQEEESIRQEQRRLAASGQIVLIAMAERAAIERDQLHRMQDEERQRIRQARRQQIYNDGIELITAEGRAQIMQTVLEQVQHEERLRKGIALASRKAEIVRKFWMANGLISMVNYVPFVNVPYYNYLEDVEQRLMELETTNPA